MSANGSRCCGLAAPPTSFEYGPWRVPARSFPGPLRAWLIPLLAFQPPSRTDSPSPVRAPSSRLGLVGFRTSSRGSRSPAALPARRVYFPEPGLVRFVTLRTKANKFERACRPKTAVRPPVPFVGRPTFPAQQPTNRSSLLERHGLAMGPSGRTARSRESAEDDKGTLSPNPGGLPLPSAPDRNAGRSPSCHRTWVGAVHPKVIVRSHHLPPTGQMRSEDHMRRCRARLTMTLRDGPKTAANANATLKWMSVLPGVGSICWRWRTSSDPAETGPCSVGTPPTRLTGREASFPRSSSCSAAPSSSNRGSRRPSHESGLSAFRIPSRRR